MKRHPWGKIPVMTTADGFTLHESRAICKYLARKYSFPLLPDDSDPEAVALFDQAQDTEKFYFAEPASKIVFEKFVKQMMGLPTDEAALSDAVRLVEAFFDVVEPLLKHRDYMAGNKFSLVDIYYIPLIQKLFACGYGNLIHNREPVCAWWARCVNRAAIQTMFAADRKAKAAVTQ